MSECSNDAEGPDGCAFDLNALRAHVAQLEAERDTRQEEREELRLLRPDGGDPTLPSSRNYWVHQTNLAERWLVDAHAELDAAITRAEKAEEEARFFAEQTNAASDRLVAVMNQRVAALARAEAAEAANTRLREALERIENAWDKSWDCSADPGHKVMHDAFRALLSGETKP